MNDLIVLVPDKNMEYAIKTLLARVESLRIRPVTVEIHTHPGHDPGCFVDGPDFLRFAVKQAQHVLVMLDCEGSGRDQRLSRQDMELDLQTRLENAGWAGRATAIVIDPEFENWVWSDSPHVDAVLGWVGRTPNLRTWLTQQGYLIADSAKPLNPKAALLAAIRVSGKSRTSKLYSAIAEKVALNRCSDEAFKKLKQVLSAWFGIANK
jgi:hypothetical protein